MATYNGITIRFVNAEDRTSDDPWCGDQSAWLQLEQGPVPPTSVYSFQGWAEENGIDLNGISEQRWRQYFEQYQGDCEDGSVSYDVFVLRSPADVSYDLTTTHGELEQQGSKSTERNTTVNIRNASEYVLNTQTQPGTVQGEFVDPVLDARGNQIDAPNVSSDGTTLSWNQPVTGVLRLLYVEVKDHWRLLCVPKDATEMDDDGTTGAFNTTVMAVWRCGEEFLDITATEEQERCGNYSSSTQVNPDDYRCYDLNVVYDRCTNNKVSETRVEVNCEED